MDTLSTFVHHRQRTGALPVRHLLLMLAATSCALTACSHQQVYDSAQHWRLEDCKSLTGTERERCLQQAREPYNAKPEFKEDAGTR